MKAEASAEPALTDRRNVWTAAAHPRPPLEVASSAHRHNSWTTVALLDVVGVGKNQLEIVDFLGAAPGHPGPP